MYNPFSLVGKTILVTGASSGIGRATAIECSRMGATIVLTARNEERLQETLSQLDGHGHRYICAELSDEESIKKLVNELPTIDGCVFCAGVSQLRPILAIKKENIDMVFGTNFLAPVLLTKLLASRKLINNAGSLVYIASVSGNGNFATGLTAYGTSKSALVSFVKYAAVELAGRKIRCNAVLPGRIETELLQNQLMSSEDLQRDKDKYLLKRYGTPQDVANAIVYLLSDASSWVTGTALKVDGGLTLN